MANVFTIDIYWEDATTPVKGMQTDIILDGSVVHDIEGEDKMELKLDIRHSDFQYILKRRVLHLNHTTANHNRKYRINKISKKLDSDGKFYAIAYCDHIKYDLGKEIHPFQGTIIDRNTSIHIAQILNGSQWSLGSIASGYDVPLTVEYDYAKRLADLQKIAEMVGCTLRFNNDFTVDIYSPSTSVVATIEEGVNLGSLNYEVREPVANRVYAIGGIGSNGLPLSLKRAIFRVYNAGSGYVDVEALNVVPTEEALNNCKIGKLSTSDPYGAPVSSLYSITGVINNYSSTGRARVYFSGGSFVPRDFVGFFDASGNRLDYVPNKEDSYTSALSFDYPIEEIIKDANVEDVLNLVGPQRQSAFSGIFTGGLCEGWDIVGNNVSCLQNTNTTYVINGTKSQKVTVDGFPDSMSAPSLTTAERTSQLEAGTYSYKLAPVSTDGAAVPISSASIAINRYDSIIVQRPSLPSGDHVKGWRVYRTKKDGSTYYQIAELSVTDTLFFDQITDDRLTLEPGDGSTYLGGQGIKADFATEVGEIYSAIVYLIVVSGRVRVELESGGEIFPPVELVSISKATPDEGEKTYRVKVQGMKAADTTGSLKIVSHEGAAQFYVDSAVVVKSPYVPNADRFVADNSGLDLWQQAVAKLKESVKRPEKIDIEAIDLKAGLNINSHFLAGQTINVTSSTLGVNKNILIKRKSFQILEPWKAQIDLDNDTDSISYRAIEDKKKIAAISAATARLATNFASNMRRSNKNAVEISSMGVS